MTCQRKYQAGKHQRLCPPSVGRGASSRLGWLSADAEITCRTRWDSEPRPAWMFAMDVCSPGSSLGSSFLAEILKSQPFYQHIGSAPSQLNSQLHLQLIWLLQGRVSSVGITSDACCVQAAHKHLPHWGPHHLHRQPTLALTAVLLLQNAF